MPEPLRRCLPLLALVLIAGCASLAAPSVEPPASAVPTSASTPTVVASPTPSPSPTPTTNATPIPDPTVMELEAIGCEGGVVLDWSASTHPQFHHYTALRSPSREIEPDYPPIAPAVDWGDTYATDRFVTSAVDASILPSDTRWNYRVMAYDIEGRVVSSSPVRTARLSETVDLGDLRVSAGTNDVTLLEWEPYEGDPACFSSYEVVSGTTGTPTTVVRVISDPAVASLETDALHVGITYALRVRAMRATTLGSFVVAQTEIASYSVP
jgi:hypothetical protein